MSSHESGHYVKTLDYAIENTVSFISFPPHMMNKCTSFMSLYMCFQAVFRTSNLHSRGR